MIGDDLLRCVICDSCDFGVEQKALHLRGSSDHPGVQLKIYHRDEEITEVSVVGVSRKS
jgi:hypothetical protein